jgi:prepilin-type N-terminal cleavage/methylation domain-containing protein
MRVSPGREHFCVLEKIALGLIMPKKDTGFTLIEVLCVIAIVSILTAVILPVLAQAKRDAYRASSTSNLRQCGLALMMYCDDYGGYQAMPSSSVATSLLQKAPTCDPEDTWRHGCTETFGTPLIGSYAYVLSVAPFSASGGWDFMRHMRHNPTLMVSIYYADSVPAPFLGDAPDIPNCLSTGKNCLMPNHVLRLHLDGSVTFSPPLKSINGGKLYMNWSSLFLDDNDGP